MFKKLRNKLKDWTKNLTKKAEETEEPLKEESKEILKEIKEVAKKEKISEPELEKTEIVSELIKEPSEKKSEEESFISEPKQEKTETVTDLIEKEKEEDEPGKPGFFKKVFSKVQKVKISEKDFDVYAEELELLLLENNVALEVAEKIIKELRQEIIGKELLKKEVEIEIKDIFKEILRKILIEPFDVVEKIKSREDKTKPYVILFCGINGTGKTTTIAKIASSLKEKGLSCVLAAGDTFRAASIEQLKTHAEKINVPIVAHEYESDPASVGFDAIKYAEKHCLDCVLIDSAGRMHTSKNLMSQIEKIAKVCKPDLKIFVGESITGNDIVEQVKSFDWAINIDGIILTKADIDEKGGTALSVGYVTKKPILYLGTGQEYDKIEPFDKQKFIKELGLDED